MTTYYIDPRNGHTETVDAVSAWALAITFGPFFFLFKGIISWFFIAALLNLFTFGLAWIPLSFFANAIHRQHLLKQGFRTKEYHQRQVNTQRIEPC